ncbi:amino acid adenylation domain-containing protein [Actinosynnema sp. NPDC020468]|uniref:non-ribosomal peptide synthetase n=1 Tax=Actinosynnema sp. NPDC020468 TaxID=3154488 RepID=UPI0033EB4491
MTNDIEDAYPLTLLQSGMLFHSALDRGTATYHDISTLRVSGPFDQDALRATLGALTARHEILRTGIDLTRFSTPLQLVHRDVEIPFSAEDLRGEPDQEARIAAWREEEKATPFQTSLAPLLRVHVQRLAEEEFLLNIAFHHAILDGWSLSLLTTELLADYDAALAGVVREPAAKPTPFREFVALEQAALADPSAAAFWTGLVGDVPFAGLPHDGGDLEPVRTHRVHEVPLDDVAEGVRAAAARAGASVKAVLFAAHARVLSLLTGRSRTVTGRVGNGRLETAGGDRTAGLFLNTLPLVVDSTGTWLEIARRIHDQETEALPYRRYPLAQIQQDLGRDALFETVVDHRSFRSYADLELSKIALTGSEFFEQTNFPFTANFATDPVTGRVGLRINYDAARFPLSRVESIGEAYAAALRFIASDPAVEASTVDLLGADRALLLDDWNATATDGTDRSVVELLEGQAARTPDAVALRFADRSLTYRELHDLADRLAGHLRASGVGPDTFVGVRQRRSPNLVVSLLAVLKAGGAYLPLDPEYPPARLEHMLRDSAAPVVLADPDLVGDPVEGRTVVPVTADLLDGLPEPTAAVPVRPGDLAYAIYTSGSTGLPKGVRVPHRALVNLLRSFGDVLRLTPADRLLALTSLSFDIAGLEVWLPLLTGAELVLSPDLGADGPRLRATVEESGATVVQATPSSWRLLVEAGLGANPGLRVIAGGEALPAEVADALAERFGEVWNAYGPTETTIWSTVDRVRGGAAPRIGRPIANTVVRVLDDRFGLVPPGVPGELLIGGVGLAHGYHGKPGLTADRFVPDPYGPPGARLYRTGDLARWNADGVLEFLGRIDQQVKVRGFRIEPGEVEVVLAGHEGVGRVVVVTREDRPGDVRLVAYLSPPAGGVLPGPAELRALAARSLPAYMVPSAFVTIDRWPVTPNGKLDRRALPAPGGVEVDGPSVAPRTATEARVAELWADVLGVERIGVTDGFLESGGNSIAALRLVMRVQEELGADVPVAVLFEGGTVRTVAEIVDGTREASTSVLVRLKDTGDKPPLFFVHPLGGSVFCYTHLVATLPEDQPFYAIQAPDLAGPDGPRPQTLEEIAALYLEAVREVQPTGPYHLGGWCMGGMVTYEMARQLDAAGERVGSLQIVSASINDPVPPRYAVDEAAAILGAFAYQLDITEDELRALDPETRLVRVLELAAGNGVSRADAGSVGEIKRLVALYQRHARALLKYRDEPREPYRGETVLVRAETELFGDGDLGWADRVAGGLVIEESPGDHYSMLEPPNVTRLVGLLLGRTAPESPRATAV